jgi:ketosteroid isomerase-like protein
LTPPSPTGLTAGDLSRADVAAGDLDGLVALYASDACVVAQSGETIVGRDRIREVLTGLIRSWKLIVGDPNGRARR